MAEEVLAERLAERLARRPRLNESEVIDWRFDLSAGWMLRVGLRDGRLGGPYEPPTAANGTAGRVYLRWSDGAVSHGSLDSGALDHFEERLAEWRANAYHDPDASGILPPQPLPEVRTADPAVAALVEGEPDPLLAWLQRGRSELEQAGLARIQAESSAGRGWRFVFSSRGLRAAYPETSARFSLSAEELYRRFFAKRRLPAEVELRELLDDTRRTAAILKTEAEPPVGELPLLLQPGLAMSLVGTFLVSNLAGSSVVAGRSVFSLDDFRAGKAVVRDDLSVMVDTTLDLEGAACPLSAEGVPGGRATLVTGGCLARPALDLKYAARAGFPPTPVPGGGPSFLLESSQPLAGAASVWPGLRTGLQLHSVLGLHTQDAVTGRYSLISQGALVVRDGMPQGRAKVSLGGNFLEHLRDPRTRLVRFPWGVNPGLLIWTSVERQA